MSKHSRRHTAMKFAVKRALKIKHSLLDEEYPHIKRDSSRAARRNYGGGLSK